MTTNIQTTAAERIRAKLDDPDLTQASGLMIDRADLTALLDQPTVTENDLASLLGEGFHTAFRKAVDSTRANSIWHAIDGLPAAEWGAIIDFVAWGTAYSLGLTSYVGEDERPGWDVEQIRAHAIDRINRHLLTLDAETDAELIEELSEYRDEFVDEDFDEDLGGLHMLALLMGVKVAPSA